MLSTGTLLDSRVSGCISGGILASTLRHVEAQVIGDHGTSQVFLWSSARIAGVPLATLLKERGEKLDDMRQELEKDVRYANIMIIEGHEASQYGIGIVSARIAEMVFAMSAQ